MILRRWQCCSSFLTSVLAISHVVHAYNLNLSSEVSMKNVSKGLAKDLMSFYNGYLPGKTPGLLPEPYYWWEGGALMGAMIQYWYYTQDPTYNEITTQGLLHQVGPYNDYMPPNQTLTEGNDDQGFWGMAVLAAAEYGFPNPPKDQPQWLALAQAVFNTQAARWDTQHCNGGLRWQVFPWNNGFDYKNSISQACFFNIAARLALYTGNKTYADWAIKTWDWMEDVKLLDKNYRIYDGVHVGDECAKAVPYEFSYNVGAFLHGASAMYAFANKLNQTTSKSLWQTRVDGLLNATELVFFWGNSTANRVMIEIACEPVNFCNNDQQSFKAYLSRWMAGTTKWAPWTFKRIKRLLENSATAAVKQCVGGENGQMCGLKWANNSGKWDGTTGVGEQMAAMEVVLANFVKEAQPPPVTSSTGGTSPGDPAAGVAETDDGRPDASALNNGNKGIVTLSNAEKAGAIVITVFISLFTLIAIVWMLMDEDTPVKQKQNNAQDPKPVDNLKSFQGREPATTYVEMGKDRPVVPANIPSIRESSIRTASSMSWYTRYSPSIESEIWDWRNAEAPAVHSPVWIPEPAPPTTIVLSRHHFGLAVSNKQRYHANQSGGFF